MDEKKVHYPDLNEVIASQLGAAAAHVGQLIELTDENKRLREALEWYARSENYDLLSAVQSDHGERARRALNPNNSAEDTH